jgi:hypothetical protein
MGYKSRKLICLSGILAGVMFLFGGSVRGQTNTPPDTRNNSDKTERSAAHINPTTLGMELSIPLGGAPGRGGNSLPITFNYSSKVWRGDYYREVSGGITTYSGYPKYGEHSNAGWTSSLQQLYIEETSIVKIIPLSGGGSGGGNGCPYVGAPGCNPTLPSGGGYYCFDAACHGAGICVYPYITIGCDNVNLTGNPNPYYIIPKITVHLPDGSTSELVSTLTPIYVPSNGTLPPQNTYFSIDGSNIRLERNQPNGPLTIILPSGSRYEFDSDNFSRLVVRYTDRNGNKMISQSNHLNEDVEWTDTIGRTIPDIRVPTDPNRPGAQIPGDRSYLAPGLPGAARNYTFKWRKLEDSFADPNYQITAWGVLFNNIWSNIENNLHNPVVLKEIDLPNGTTYQFSYNIYGEIEKITYPSGAVERFNYHEIPPFSSSFGQGNNVMHGQANRGVVDQYRTCLQLS